MEARGLPWERNLIPDSNSLLTARVLTQPYPFLAEEKARMAPPWLGAFQW